MTESKFGQEPQSKFGIVVMLDALGARAFTKEGAEDFIRRRNALLENTNIVLQLGSIGGSEGPHSEDPVLTTFGDNIVITWAVQQEVANCALSAVALALAPLIAEGIRYGLLFRGAVAVGDFVHDFVRDKATILGPAIGDAASWHEQALWVGVVATPACGLRWSWNVDAGCGWDTPNRFVQYDKVPLKGNRTMPMWVVAWPGAFLTRCSLESYHGPRKIKCGERTWSLPSDFLNVERGFLHQYLSRLAVPFGTEDKYANTIKFFDWYVREKGGWIQENIEHCQRLWFSSETQGPDKSL